MRAFGTAFAVTAGITAGAVFSGLMLATLLAAPYYRAIKSAHRRLGETGDGL